MKTSETLTSKLQHLYKLQDTIPKLIEIDDERLQQNWKEHYRELRLLSKRKQQNAQEYTQTVAEKCEIENIFDQIDENSSAAGKVLLLGESGAGKTTLLHNISYRWGAEELWNDNFDYMFRIRLKILLNSNWDKNYEKNEKNNLLACLIHRSLTLQITELQRTKKLENEFEIKLSEISEIVNKDKVLLLLDGYNEIESFARSQDRYDEYNKIIGTVFEHKYVIMSSRPNSLKADEQNKFERIVENRGLDLEGIIQYVKSCFAVDQEHGTNLTLFLQRNAEVRGMCELPINIGLICLIWEDKNVREKFQETTELNIASLYREVIIWLGKRYLAKFEDRDPENIAETNILNSTIVKFLKGIAHESWINQGNFINNEVIKNHLNTLDIKDVFKFGLLRAESDKTKIVDLDYQFIHPTFQEYFTADYLKELMKGDLKQVKEVCYLIGQHRNEPQYLMVLKFLAGIVSNEQDKQLVEKLWTAITCNVDGVLELGLETKITLLMHLLEQSKVTGNLNIKIPNLIKIQELIDGIVPKDITKWREQIINSGYVSEKIKNVIVEQLNDKIEEDNLELRVAIEIITNLPNKSEFKGRETILNQVINLIATQNWQLQKLGLEKLHQILDRTISDKILKENLSKVIPLIGNKNLNKFASSLLTKIIYLAPDLSHEVLNYVENVFKNPNQDICDNDLKSATIKIIPEIIKYIPEKYETTVVNKALGLLIYVIKSNVDTLHKSLAIENIKKVVKVAPKTQAQEVAKQVIELLTPVLNDQIFVACHKSHAIEILEALKTIPLEQQVTDITKKLYSLLLNELKNPNLDINSRFEALASIIKLVKVVDPKLDVEIVEVFHVLNSMNFKIKEGSYENFNLIHHIPPLMEIIPLNQSYNIAVQAIYLLTTLLKQSLTYDDTNIRSIVVTKMGELVQTIPQQVAVQEKILLFDTLLKGKFLEITDTSFAFAFINSIIKIMKILPPNTREEYPTINEIFNTLLDSLKNIGTSHLSHATLTNIVELLKLMPSNQLFTMKVFNSMVDIIKQQNARDYFKILALNNIEYLIDMLQNQVSTVIDEVLALLVGVVENSSTGDCKGQVLCSIPKLLKFVSQDQAPIVVNKILDLLAGLINNPNTLDCKVQALRSVPKLLKFMPLDQISIVTNKVLEVLVDVINNPDAVKYLDFPRKNMKISGAHILTCPEVALDSISELLKFIPLDQTSVLLMQQVFNKVISQYNNNIYGTKVKEVISVVPLNKSVDLLSHDTKEIREAAKKGILLKLTSTNELTRIDYTQIVDILKIINSSKGKDEYEKQLYIAATDKLNQIVVDINEEGVEWLSKNFHNLPNLSETKTFLKGLYHKVLKEISTTGRISITNSTFIIKCIEYDFTTTIKRIKDSEHDQDESYTYQLVFENVSYTIHNTNKLYLENIVQAVSKQDNILAKQYEEHKPLFVNDGKSGLDIAATDIKECSIVDDNHKISTESWRLSLMHLSDHKKQEPSAIFILLEKRDYFGYHVIHKIYIEEGKICDKPYVLHPNAVSIDVCKEIFGEMKYIETKPRYYCSILEIPLKTEDELIQKLEYHRSKGEESDYVVLHQFFNNYENIQDTLWKDILWDEYVKQESVKTFKKDALLKLDAQQLEVVRRDSRLIDNSEMIGIHGKSIAEFQEKTQGLRNIVEHNDKISQRDKVVMQQKINNIEKKMECLVENNVDVKSIVKEMTTLISEGKVTKGRLIDLEDDIDNIRQKIGIDTSVYMLDKIVYVNPILNHPNLLKDALKIFSFSQILDFLPKLNQDLIIEAINSEDSLLILSGLVSLDHSD